MITQKQINETLVVLNGLVEICKYDLNEMETKKEKIELTTRLTGIYKTIEMLETYDEIVDSLNEFI
jgi:hypothetical protein